MLKYAGIVLISGAISLYGAHLSYRLRRAGQIRGALYELLLHIKNGIDNGALPLDDIYAGFYNKLLDECGFLTPLKSRTPGALANALTNSDLRLPAEMERLYASLAGQLGKSGFRKSESERLARYMALIGLEEEKLRKTEEVRQVLYRKLGLLCGLFAALILI